MIRNTGKFIFSTLREVDKKTGKPTGRVKSNKPTDPDYASPIVDVQKCPVGGLVYNIIIEVNVRDSSKPYNIEKLFDSFRKVGVIDWGDREEDYNPIAVTHNYNKNGYYLISIFALEIDKIYLSRIENVEKAIKLPEGIEVL